MRGRVFSYRTELRTDGTRRTVKSATAKDRSDKWAYEFAVFDPATGKRRSQSKAGFAGKQAAARALAGAITEYEDRGRQVPSEAARMTLSEFILDEWLPVTRAQCKPTTVANYEVWHRAYVQPHIGATPLRNVTSGMLLRLFTLLGERGGRGGKPLSKSTVHHVHVLLSSVFGYAVETGHLRANPSKAMAKRAKPKQAKIDPDKLRHWTPAEAERFLASAVDDRQYALYVVALNLGLRRGELAGLRWTDVAIDRTDEPTLFVGHQRVTVGYAVQEASPKTEESVRRLELDQPVVTVLKAHRTRQIEERLAWGASWSNDGNWVFTEENGSPSHPQTIAGRFQSSAKRAGVPWIGLHGMRHTMAVLALAAGVPLKVVSERLGHTSTAFTADLYQHVIPGMQRAASSKISAALGIS